MRTQNASSAQALTHYPQDPDLLFHSAQAEWLGDENETAENDGAPGAGGSTREHAPARQLLASVLIERDEYADGELLLIGLLREYPESAELYGRYSRLMLRTLHLEKAEQLARAKGCATTRGRRMPAGGGAVRDRAQRSAAERRAAETPGRASGIDELRACIGRGAGGLRAQSTKRIALPRARCAPIRPTNTW